MSDNVTVRTNIPTIINIKKMKRQTKFKQSKNPCLWSGEMVVPSHQPTASPSGVQLDQHSQVLRLFLKGNERGPISPVAKCSEGQGPLAKKVSWIIPAKIPSRPLSL